MTTIPPTIVPRHLHDRIATGQPCRLVDVRTPAEHRAEHVTGAHLLPLDQLDPARLPAGDGPLFLLCQGGGRATRAAEQLRAAGVACCVVEGGTKAWAAAGLPVTRGKGVIALERQVRIAAGLLVLTGAVLAWFVHPGFVGLCAFIGAGLTFAGITDWCGMALLLARMPWNRARPAATAPASPLPPAGDAPCCKP
jgi:rhodanese-related sulfurtransferase